MKNYTADFDLYLQKKGYSRQTRVGYGYTVLEYCKWVVGRNIAVETVDYTTLLEWVENEQGKGNLPRTINQKLAGIDHLYRFLDGDNNPAGQIRLTGVLHKSLPPLLKPESLYDAWRRYPARGLVQKRNRAMLGMLIWQAPLKSELAAMSPGAVNLESGEVEILPTKTTNGRTLPLAPEQMIGLQYYLSHVRPALLELRGKPSKKLFVSSGQGNKLSNSMGYLFKALRKINPHIKTGQQIRSSVIRHWLKAHGLRKVQYMCGHKYASSTQRYQEKNIEGLQEMIDSYHPLNW